MVARVSLQLEKNENFTIDKMKLVFSKMCLYLSCMPIFRSTFLMALSWLLPSDFFWSLGVLDLICFFFFLCSALCIELNCVDLRK